MAHVSFNKGWAVRPVPLTVSSPATKTMTNLQIDDHRTATSPFFCHQRGHGLI